MTGLSEATGLEDNSWIPGVRMARLGGHQKKLSRTCDDLVGQVLALGV